jgi:hypothetical protein
MMFNSPAGHSDAMDLAKMLALLEMIADLEGSDFRIWRQTRTGLLSYPIDKDLARGHLAASVYLQMVLMPHIVHVVGYTEADHAATEAEVIESCKLASQAIENALHGQPDMSQDSAVQARKKELIQEARINLDAIRSLASASISDPLVDAAVLAKAVTSGILDAPQLKNNRYARGEIITHIDNRGACVIIDPVNSQPVNEKMRLKDFII